MKLSHTVNSDQLSTDEASELDNLIRSADIKNLPPRPPGLRPRPDVFYYQLVIVDDDDNQTIKVSDADMPASLRPLVEWLTKRAAQDR
jgi:hypothetical protein